MRTEDTRQGLRPALAVFEGGRLEAGQVLFSDKNRPALALTAPWVVTIVEMRRSAQRTVQALVLETDAAASDGTTGKTLAVSAWLLNRHHLQLSPKGREAPEPVHSLLRL